VTTLVEAWEHLLSTALVGTARRPVPASVLDAAATALGGPVPEHPAEAALLTAAGVLGTCRRAGWVPVGDGEDEADPGSGARAAGSQAPGGTAAPDERPEASARAVQVLELLLAERLTVPGGTRWLVQQWLEGCAVAGRRPPPLLLPTLLDHATAVAGVPAAEVAAVRAAVVGVGGPRLRWLAARSERWRWAVADGEEDADAAAVFAEGTPGERLAVLRAVRAADPAAGLALLRTTWDDDPAAERARFVEVLRSGLSPDDEPFLEAALDDRSKAVRAVAADLLARLPGSALGTRMAERVRSLVGIEGRLRRRLAVERPGAPDEAARRDGILPTGAPAGTGTVDWVLVQLVGATPLVLWAELVDDDPAQVVRLGAGEQPLLAGWALAARRQVALDPGTALPWALAVLPAHPDPALLAALPPDVARAQLPALLRGVPDTAATALVAAAPGPWDLSTSRAVLARLRAVREQAAVLGLHPVLAARLDPTAAPEIEDWAGSKEGARAGYALRTIQQSLSIRRTIAEELA
jgi:hypothetical protein